MQALAETDDETLIRSAARATSIVSRACTAKRPQAGANIAPQAKREKDESGSQRLDGVEGEAGSKLPPIEADRISILARLVADAVQWGGGDSSPSFSTSPSNFPRLSATDLALALRTLKEYRIGQLRRNKCVLTMGLTLSHLRAWIDAALRCAGCASRHSSEATPLAVCDACARAWHAGCVGLAELPGTVLFFCPRCIATPILPLAKLWSDYKSALPQASITAAVTAPSSSTTNSSVIPAAPPPPPTSPPRPVIATSSSYSPPPQLQLPAPAAVSTHPPPNANPNSPLSSDPAAAVAALASSILLHVSPSGASSSPSSFVYNSAPVFSLPVLEDIRKRGADIVALERQLTEADTQIEARSLLASAEARRSSLLTQLQTEHNVQVRALSDSLNESHRLFYELLEALAGSADRRQLDQIRQLPPAALVQRFRAVLGRPT